MQCVTPKLRKLLTLCIFCHATVSMYLFAIIMSKIWNFGNGKETLKKHGLIIYKNIYGAADPLLLVRWTRATVVSFRRLIHLKDCKLFLPQNRCFLNFSPIISIIHMQYYYTAWWLLTRDHLFARFSKTWRHLDTNTEGGGGGGGVNSPWKWVAVYATGDFQMGPMTIQLRYFWAKICEFAILKYCLSPQTKLQLDFQHQYLSKW